ncbi:aerolysin-like protein [Hemibagrus wyckioides]|uniref:aerolysin-like protein n=1 Tax=Hemibagrus wyckioides TaxID=337641 RepID=UPI00266DBEB6|nr:aerolysin-like protein [Hemibagrus wyckioides]XP_058273283.1 aerolysin-like protein [Hemibagrus wyckioides]XP_058273311.1 aerolysin-like protein [Hemibagrus wyckioides]
MSYLANVVEVGGKGGEAFHFDGTENGSLLKRISVWVNETTVKAVTVWLADDQSKQYGRPDGDLKEFTFEDGEHLTSLSLWPNQDGNRLGAIKFKTNLTREFHVSVTNGRLYPEVPVDVASGICIGIKGRSGWDIDRFGFIFINTIKSAELTNVEYPNIHEVIPKVKEIDIKSMSYQNNTNTTQQYQIEASEKITPTSSWSVTDQLEITFCLKVKAGIPLLVESSSGYELKVGDIGTYASVTTEEKMEFFPFSFKVPPGKTMDARTVIGEANVNLPFTGIIKITCCNDRVLEFGTSGTYKGVSFSDGKVVVNESTKTLGVA